MSLPSYSIETILTAAGACVGTIFGFKKLVTAWSSESAMTVTHDTENKLITTLSKLIDDMDARQAQLSASLDKSLGELYELRSKLHEFKGIIEQLRIENTQIKAYLLSEHGEDWDHITERRLK